MSLFAGLDRVIVGVDGCPAGWIAVSRHPSGDLVTRIFTAFGELAHVHSSALIVVDIPIGLPDISTRGGRAAEQSARTVLRRRRPSVFPVPSRSTVYLEPLSFPDFASRKAARARASVHAMLTSNPPGGLTHQSFAIFPKIQDVDGWLRAPREGGAEVFESHPEVAFCILNDGKEMAHPKKSEAGQLERRAVLSRCGFPETFLAFQRSKDAAHDDFLDACAMLSVAARICRGEATSFPSPPDSDAHGIPIAIRA